MTVIIHFITVSYTHLTLRQRPLAGRLAERFMRRRAQNRADRRDSLSTAGAGVRAAVPARGQTHDTLIKSQVFCFFKGDVYAQA